MLSFSISRSHTDVCSLLHSGGRFASKKKSCVKTFDHQSSAMISKVSAVTLLTRAKKFCVSRGVKLRSLHQQMNNSTTKDNAKLVGLGGFEPPTSPLSGVRSNQLSYRPVAGNSIYIDPNYVCEHSPRKLNCIFLKGGDPAAGSPTATLLRLHPSHLPHRGKRPPYG